MGVRQLNKFIKENVPDGYIPVSLSQECDTFMSDKEGTKPILVVDLNALLRPSIKIKKDLLFGIRHNIVQKNLTDWIDKLHNIAELIFFVDGIRSDDKIRKRQEDKSEKSKTLLEKIETGRTVEEIMESKDLPDAKSHLKIAEDLAKKYGSLKKAMDRECDAEMVIYANENPRVLAILSDDTDFLIFSGNWKHLSLIDMDQETLDTKEYNREALRKALGLNDKELVILSTLNGNDVITFNDTFGFHKSLVQENKNNPALRFPAIAQYIKKRQLLFSKNLTSQISYIIFESISDSYDQKIKDSLDMYDLNLNLDSTSFDNETLKYCKENEFNYAFKILNNKIIKISLTYYDHSRPVNSFRVVICLIRKHIGIILNKKPVQNYEIFSKKSKNDQNLSTFVVNKIVPEFEIPPLIELWDRLQYPKHDSVRFKLLKWLVSEERLKEVNLELIPKNVFIDILTLTFMVSEGLIDVIEADIILLSIKQVEDDQVPENLTAPNILNRRAFFVSFMFSNCIIHIEDSLKIIGFKDHIKTQRFDGMLFHICFQQYIDQHQQIKELLLEYTRYRVYA